MELTEARTIVKSLAEGIDPVTGEAFAQDSPYNHPTVIRALFTITNFAQPISKPKLSIDERRRRNLDLGRPRNFGLPWTKDDRELVASGFKEGRSIEELAQKIQRSPGSIHGELVRQGLVSHEYR